ncbi:MAG: peptidoglycan-binding protein [Patescibacteria group bacterium]
MSIRKTIITTVVALTLVAMIAPGVAQGVTIDELLAQITALQAQLVALQGGTTTTGTAPTACAGITLTRTLVKGSTGSDVKCVQALLNTDTATQVAVSGVGSAGNETTTYGNLTVAAVKKFQAKYGTGSLGTVGPNTRAKMNLILTGGTTGGTTGGGTTGGTTPPVVVPTGAGLTVGLAYNNPASGTVILAQGLAPLAKFTFTNGDNAEVKVTNLKVNRIGVSLDATLANVYLFNGAKRLTDAASVSSGVITFNDASGLFTVPSGGSTTITVAADLAASAGQTVGAAINASTSVTTNASSVKGTYPINGNLMTAATATGAGVEFAATTTPSTNTSLTPQNDYTVWQNSVVISTRAVDFTRIAFREIGSVKKTDLQNFRLYVDGVQVGSAVANLDGENGYVTFDLSASPKRMEAGTRVIKLVADIIGGSSLNFKFRVSVSADANFVDTQYNVNTAPTTATTTGSFTVADVTSGVQTVASGTLTFTKQSTSPSGDIVNTAPNATLAKYTLTAAGEPVKVESLYVRIIFTNVTGTDNCTAASTVCTDAASMLLRSGMVLANGVQIGSTTAISPVAAGTLFSPGSSLIVTPGSPVTLEVKGDIYDATGTYNDIDATDTLQVSIIAGSSNAQGTVSLASLSAPSAATNGNTLTVATGALTLSKYPAYTDQTVVAPLTAHKLAHFTLTANTTESVNVTAINVALNSVASSYGSNLYVVYGDKTTTIKPTVSTSDSWSINHTLPAGNTIDIMVYADFSSSAAGTAYATVDIDGTTVSSATSADTSGTVDGQNIAFSTGSFTTTSSSSPLNQVAAGNQTVDVANYVMTSSYQQYTVTEMRFSMGSDTIAQAVVSASLKDASGTVLKTIPYDTANDRFYFTGLNIVIPASTSKTVTIAYTLSPGISATASSSNVDVKPTLTHVKRQDPNGTVTTDTTFTTAAGNTTLVYKAVPVLTLNDLNNSTYMSNGAEQSVYSFKAKADKGDITMKQFKLAVSWSDGGTVAQLGLGNLKLEKNGLDITSSVSILNEDGLSVEGSSSGVSENDSTIVVAWDGNTADTILSGGEVTYTIKGTPEQFRTGTGSGDTAGVDSVSVVFSRDTAAQTASHTYLNANASLGIIGLHDSAAAATGDAEEATMIWSDMSAVGHAPANGTVGTSSDKDWTNSYLLESILNSETWLR